MVRPLVKILPGTRIDPRYPDEDGRPMGDTDQHSIALIWLREAVEDFFADVPDVYVASNLILYYEHGNPGARRDPDVLVARGVVGKHARRSFRVWEEGLLPCTLFEVASRKTWREDIGEKRLLYARIGIKEYFLFDPENRYLQPALQGYRSRRGQPVPMKPARDGSLKSRQLGLRLVPEGRMLRLRDLHTDEPVLTRHEQAEYFQQRAAEERRRAAEERQRAAKERQRADELAAQLRALRQELRRLRGNGQDL
jgi:Uma2 family endonuclease